MVNKSGKFICVNCKQSTGEQMRAGTTDFCLGCCDSTNYTGRHYWLSVQAVADHNPFCKRSFPSLSEAETAIRRGYVYGPLTRFNWDLMECTLGNWLEHNKGNNEQLCYRCQSETAQQLALTNGQMPSRASVKARWVTKRN